MAGTRSGYQRTISLCPDDLIFVDPLPKHLALECPICYNLFLNPHIVSCCGNHFCEHCLERVKENENPCPMCKDDFTSMRDKALQRNINQLEVFCPHSCKDQGDESDGESVHCEWSGELGLLEGHLNIGNRNGGCKFVSVGCVYGCGYSTKRCQLADHELVCSKRPFSCDYCGEYQSTCEDVTDRHWKVCKSYPIECPNVCQLRYLARGKLEDHLKKDCELQVVPCRFMWTGCEVKAQRLNLANHEKESVVDHLEKLCISASNLVDTIDKLKQSNSSLEKTVKELRQNGVEQEKEIKHLKDQNTDLSKVVYALQYENDAFKKQVNEMFTETSDKEKELAHKLFSLESSIGVPPFSFIMDNLQEHLEKSKDFFSPPFYSRIGGYRLRIKVTPNGIFFGEGTHISLTVYLMKGVFDDNLVWPFRGSVIIALMDQCNDKDHKVDMVTFDNGTTVKVSGQVLNGDIHEKGLVMYEFFDHAWLEPTSRKRKLYVKDNKLLFKVMHVHSS